MPKKPIFRRKDGLKGDGRKLSRLRRLLTRVMNPRAWSLRTRVVHLSGVLLLLGNVILILFLSHALNADIIRTGSAGLDMLALRVKDAILSEEKALSLLVQTSLDDSLVVKSEDLLAHGGVDSAHAALAETAGRLGLISARPDLLVWLAMERDKLMEVEPEDLASAALVEFCRSLPRRKGPRWGVVQTGAGLVVAAGAATSEDSAGAVWVVGNPLSEVLSLLDVPSGYGAEFYLGDVAGEPSWSMGLEPPLDQPVVWTEGRARVGSYQLKRMELPRVAGGTPAFAVLMYDASGLEEASWNRIYQFSWFFISGAILLWVALFSNVARVERFLARLRSIIIASHANDFADRFESDHVHCLEIMECHNEECPVYQNTTLVCHLETGSEAISPRWRNTCIFLNVYESCANCPVYSLRSGDELNEMRNVVNTMMRLWGRFLARVGELLSHVLRTQPNAGRSPSLDEISDRLEQMAKLTAFSHDLQGARDKDEVYGQLAWVFESQFSVTALVVLEIGNGRNNFDLAWDASGDMDLAGPELEVDYEHCRASRTATDVISYHNPALCPYFNCDHDKEFRCCMPIIMSGQVGAVLSFVASRRRWDRTNDMLPVMRKYLDEAGPVLSSLRLLGLTKDQALRDPLTKAYNRRFLDEYLNSYEPQRRRDGFLTGLLMADIDHFKRVNDEHGHEAGDLVLKEVAAIISTRIRRSDLLIRYGGEEFLMLLQGVASGSSLKVAEDIRSAVERYEFVLPSGQTVRKTISIGVCEHPNGAATLEKAISAADAALYECKRQGRNRVMLYPDSGSNDDVE
ncbi:MAG: GGDEF domain-containing protein [Desulfovibrionaceae bacterium]